MCAHTHVHQDFENRIYLASVPCIFYQVSWQHDKDRYGSYIFLGKKMPNADRSYMKPIFKVKSLAS